jgi:hypothetical protein
MGIDQRAFQLLLNVAIITSATSLTVMWFLRRQDIKKVSRQISIREEQVPLASLPAQVAPAPRQLRKIDSTPVLHTLPSGDQDIRQYVARRSREWASGAETR